MSKITDADVAKLRAFFIKPGEDQVSERVYLDLTDMPEPAARALTRLSTLFRLAPNLPATLNTLIDDTLKVVEEASRVPPGATRN